MISDSACLTMEKTKHKPDRYTFNDAIPSDIEGMTQDEFDLNKELAIEDFTVNIFLKHFSYLC